MNPNDVMFRENSRGIDFFFVNQLKNNHKSGNKESFVHCLLCFVNEIFAREIVF